MGILGRRATMALRWDRCRHCRFHGGILVVVRWDQNIGTVPLIQVGRRRRGLVCLLVLFFGTSVAHGLKRMPHQIPNGRLWIHHKGRGKGRRRQDRVFDRWCGFDQGGFRCRGGWVVVVFSFGRGGCRRQEGRRGGGR